MNNKYYVYIMSNQYNTVLYTGVTNDLARRVWEHKNNVVPGFTSRYNIHKLVYFEVTSDIDMAIHREKQIKGGSRKKKEELIKTMNPGWVDLTDEIFGCG